MPYAITATGYRAVGVEFTAEELQPGETLVEELSDEYLASLDQQDLVREAVALLDAFTRSSNAQVTAIQGRIDTLNDIVELDELTEEESAELPGRLSQLKEWKRYRIALGRVTAQSTWPTAPDWPVMPESFITETLRLAVTDT